MNIVPSSHRFEGGARYNKAQGAGSECGFAFWLADLPWAWSLGWSIAAAVSVLSVQMS